MNSLPELNTFSVDDVQKAINELCKRLNCSIDKELLLDYQNGHHPTLLSYEKVESCEIKLPVIQKYLMGAQTFCDHNTHLVHFYDISRSTRHCIFVQKLNNALKICDEKVAGIEKRITRLTSENAYDSFDAIMFEIITASKYATLGTSKRVAFIDESEEKSPDIIVELSDIPIPHFVECKRYDRNVPLFLEIRDRVRDIADLTLREFFRNNISAVIDLEFICDPRDVSPQIIAKQCQDSLRKGAYIRGDKITTKVSVLEERKLDDYLLFPSPRYFWERYGYRPQGDWTAIVNAMNAQPAELIDIDNPRKMGTSTWLNEVDWECAIRWRISNEELKWKIRKLNYNRLFKGLEQLRTKGFFSTLHVWFEREGKDMIREKELADFISRLSENGKDVFSWLVFNETVMETSPMGIPDIIEHAHLLCTSIAPTDEPLVSSIFVDEISEELYEFGTGKEMPCIDDEFRKRGWL